MIGPVINSQNPVLIYPDRTRDRAVHADDAVSSFRTYVTQHKARPIEPRPTEHNNF
ncbi:hypothetical protein D3C80_1338240 [compost metagenome]